MHDRAEAMQRIVRLPEGMRVKACGGAAASLSRTHLRGTPKGDLARSLSSGPSAYGRRAGDAGHPLSWDVAAAVHRACDVQGGTGHLER